MRRAFLKTFTPLFRALLPSSTMPAYDSQSNGRRTAGWNPGIDAINALISGGGENLRAKSRQMGRNNAWANNAIESFTANVVGSGIVPRWKHPDKAIRKTLQEAWKRWTDEADADGISDFYGMQSLACRSAIEAGEVLARFRPRYTSDGMTVPLQIQLLEAEYLPLWKNELLPNGSIQQGIEFDPIRRRRAYWLYKNHPGEFVLFGSNAIILPVPAVQVLHLYKPIRPSQHRGQPFLTPVLVALHEIEKYDDAEVVRKNLAAMMCFFLEDADPTNPVNGTMQFGDNQGVDNGNIPMQGLEPGSGYTPPPGKKVVFNTPGDVGPMYPHFMRAQLQKISAGLGITYEQMTGDLTGVNYSSIRAGLLEFRRRCEMWQHQIMVFQFCRPIVRQFLDQAAIAGVINARDYGRNQNLYLDVEWKPPAWPWVDPLKDVEAEVIALDNLIKARSETIAERGYDAVEIDDQIKADQDREQALQLDRHAAPLRPWTQPQDASTSPTGPKLVEKGNAG